MERQKRIIGITCSTFDLLHTGHIIMLEECKKHCDIAEEIFKTTTIDLFIHKPVTNEKDDCTHDEKAHEIEVKT